MAQRSLGLPAGPLAAYLGVRDANQDADEESIGLLAKMQAVKDAREGRAEALRFRQEDRADRRDIARDALAERSAARQENMEFRRQQAEQGFTIKQSQLDMQRQFGQARIDAIKDANEQKKARDAFEMDFKERDLNLKREIQDFKQTQLQLGAGLAGESAGKIAMADRAVLDVREARELLFDKDGKLKRQTIAEMNVPFTAGMPFRPEARGAYSRLHNAVAAKLRIETGAAATESEVKGILDRFLPKVSDPDNVVRDRLDSLEQFMNTAIDQTKGVRLDALESRKGKKPAAAPAAPSGWSIKPAP